MNQSVIEELGVAIFFSGFIVIALKYIYHYKKLQKAYFDLGMKWPSLTQEDILSFGIFKGLQQSFTISFMILGIILFSNPNNVVLQKNLRSMRLTIFIFMILPILLGILLLSVSAVF